jgi:signal transduction histidine kinase
VRTDPAIDFPELPRSELEKAIDELVHKAQHVLRTQGRLRDLLAATRAITEDLDLEVVLRRIAQAAVDLAGARYGALGVLGPDGMLEQFIHVGVDADTAQAIGHLPRGLGILGALTTEARPLRLEHRSDDPRSVGLPEHHPPMDSFLGVPIQVRGEVFGNLYLADQADGPFSAEDEELLRALAAAAGVAIDNARLFGESQRRQRWALASAEVSSALLDQDGSDPLALIATSVIRLTDAAVVALISRTESDAFAVDGAWGEDAEAYLGRVFSAESTAAAQVIASGNPILSLGLVHPGSPNSGAFTGGAMIVPLARPGGVNSALLVARSAGLARFGDLDLDMIADFAAHASVALELRGAREARERIALFEDRERIARDLHDNVIQRLFGAGLALNGLDLDALARPARDRVEGISNLLDEAIAEIRTSVFALRANRRAAPFARHRLLDVVGEAAGSFPTPPRIIFDGEVDHLVSGDLLDDVEAVIREGLSNAARHADALSVVVSVTIESAPMAASIVVKVIDDGCGPRGSGTRRAGGTANLAARAASHGGSSELSPGTKNGSVLTWRAPLPHHSKESFR